jgi:hypothetical protein
MGRLKRRIRRTKAREEKMTDVDQSLASHTRKKKEKERTLLT